MMLTPALGGSDMGVGIDLFETGSVKYSDKSKAVGGRCTPFHRNREAPAALDRFEMRTSSRDHAHCSYTSFHPPSVNFIVHTEFRTRH